MNARQVTSRLSVPGETSAQLAEQLQRDASDHDQQVKSQEQAADQMTGYAVQSQALQVPQNSEKSSVDGHPRNSGTSSVGPWVVSNRKVQKRYRERQKVRTV